MARRSISPEEREKLRDAILVEAGKMLLEEGIHGLSMRKLSKQLGASTMMIYTCFENKQEILNYLYLQGFERLKQTLEAVPKHEDPSVYLETLGWAYRKAALDNVPSYFLMQSRAVPGFTVPEESLKKSRESFAVLITAIVNCMEAGEMVPGDPEEVAHLLWATLHGLISLQLFGHSEDEETARARFNAAIRMIRNGLAQPAKETA